MGPTPGYSVLLPQHKKIHMKIETVHKKIQTKIQTKIHHTHEDRQGKDMNDMYESVYIPGMPVYKDGAHMDTRTHR